jgi:hypothetical protein
VTVPLVAFLAVAVLAVGATLAYGYHYRDRNLYLSTGVATIAWGWLALRGSDVYLPRVGEYAPLPGLQYLALGLFVLSALVFQLAHWGVYPPGGTGNDPTTNT